MRVVQLCAVQGVTPGVAQSKPSVGRWRRHEARRIHVLDSAIARLALSHAIRIVIRIGAVLAERVTCRAAQNEREGYAAACADNSAELPSARDPFYGSPFRGRQRQDVVGYQVLADVEVPSAITVRPVEEVEGRYGGLEQVARLITRPGVLPVAVRLRQLRLHRTNVG